MFSKISQHQEMGYDRSVGVFSPDGLLLQVEYAEKAVNLGSPVLGIVYNKGILFIADKKVNSKLVISESVPKIFRVEDNIVMSASGVISDARRLIERAVVVAQQHRVELDREIDLIKLVKEIADIKQYYTQAGGLRPFGCSILYGGFKKEEPALYLTTPSGVYVQYKAKAIGKNSNKINEFLEENYQVSKLNDAINLGLSALKEVFQENFDNISLDIAYLERNNFVRLTEEEVKKFKNKLK